MVTSRKKTPRNKKSQEKCKRGKKKEKKGTAEGFVSDDTTPVDKTPIFVSATAKGCSGSITARIGNASQ